MKKFINRELILYGVVGVLTTVVSFVSLYIFNSTLSIKVEIANILSWICAVFFSFVLNRNLVFKTKGKLLKELSSFVLARIASLFVDEAIMIIGINVLNIETYICKLIAEIFIILINYFLSKYIVFKTNLL